MKSDLHLPSHETLDAETFRGSEMYRGLRAGGGTRVAEPEPGLDPFTERHLHCVWMDDRLRPADLCSERGEEVQIHHPGRWNQGKGPDFLDAEWTAGGVRRRGDVEIHLRPMDWVRHGHATDPAYAEVGLHVCYEAGELPPGELPAGCVEISLRASLDRRSHFFFDSIDLRAYPWQAESGNAGLRTWFQGLEEEEQGRVLEAAGLERLRIKTRRMAQVIRAVGPAQALWEGLLRGLGYSGNADPAEALARAVPLAQMLPLAGGDPERATALLLGCAGLLPLDADQPGLPEWLRVRRLWDLWWPLQHPFLGKAMRPEQWRLDQCRPGNHPRLRLRAAAHWLCAPEGLEDLFARGDGRPAQQWVRDCLRQLQVTEEGRRLVGPIRARVLFINAVLPWHLCLTREPPPETLWRWIPAEEMNRHCREAARVLLGPDAHPRIFRGALRRQGLLQFHEDFAL